MKKTLVSLSLVCAMLISNISAYAVEVTSRAAIVIDAETGDVFYEKNSDEPLAPASMTKVMTTYILYEKMTEGVLSKDTMITADEDDYDASTDPEATNVELLPGREYSVDDLIGAILVPSACAASAMVGKYISGSEEEFARLMNETAASLGLDAYYEDASGLSDNNRISARSMAKLSRALITKYPDVLNYTSKPYIIFHDKRYNTTNRMLAGQPYEYEMTDGLKTGTTTLAGPCFTATSVSDNIRLISVAMHSSYSAARFEDSIELLNHGFYEAFQNRDNVFATDMRMFINEEEVPVFAYRGKNGGMYMFIEDLKDYGFEINWNADTRTVTASYSPYKETSPIPMDVYNEYYSGQKLYRLINSGNSAALIYDGEEHTFTNIHAIDGFTMISADQLASFAAFSQWDGDERTLYVYF